MADKQKKFPLRSLAMAALILLVWVGGYLAVSHLFGSMPLDTDEQAAQALAQASPTGRASILASDALDGVRAYLFDPGTPDDPSDDGLALFVPDFFFRSRWCYADVVTQDAEAPLTLYAGLRRTASDEADRTDMLCAVFGTAVPDSVTSCTVQADGTDAQTIPVTGPVVLTLFSQDVSDGQALTLKPTA